MNETIKRTIISQILNSMFFGGFTLFNGNNEFILSAWVSTTLLLFSPLVLEKLGIFKLLDEVVEGKCKQR